MTAHARNEHRVRLVQLPAPSTAFLADPVLEYPIGFALALRFQYDEGGSAYQASLNFKGVLAHRHRAEVVCTAWEIEDAYDTLIELRNSSWLEELKSLGDARGRSTAEVHHYLLYLDGAGCYEVVAHSWELEPSELLHASRE